jgi:hypothetical protein
MHGNLKQDELFKEMQKFRRHLTELTAFANKPAAVRPTTTPGAASDLAEKLQRLVRVGKAFYTKAGSTA